MGLISDTYEDNRDRGADDENLAIFLPIPAPATPPGPPLHTCPICYTLLSEDALHGHLLARHAHEHVYVRLDGRVLRDGMAGWTTGEPRECELMLLGITEETAVTVRWDEAVAQRAQVAASCSLLPYIPRGYSGQITIEVRLANRARTFTIYCGRQSLFRHRELDLAVWRLQQALDAGIEPDWDGYRGAAWGMPSDISDLERRYLRGFYSYSLAAWLDRQHRILDSRRHLEEAFTLLSPFETKLARTGLGLLAIRMNAFDYLRQWKWFTRLKLACAFFVDREFEPLAVATTPFASVAGRGLYADPFLQTYLEALFAFYAQDDKLLGRCLAALDSHPLRSDANNQAKYDILQARVLARTGRHREARIFYQALVADPVFGDEAQEHLG